MRGARGREGVGSCQDLHARTARGPSTSPSKPSLKNKKNQPAAQGQRTASPPTLRAEPIYSEAEPTWSETLQVDGGH